jgi:hypothetical protein
MTGAPCVIGAADHAGWSHLVCVAAPDGVPASVERRRVQTIDAGLPTMPYHHESLGMPVDEANALIARVGRSIAQCTVRALQRVVADLAPAYRVVALAVREPTFPELPHTVEIVRQSYQLQCAADGMMWKGAPGVRKTHGPLCGSTCAPTTSRRSSPGRVARPVRPGPRSTGGPMRPASRRSHVTARFGYASSSVRSLRCGPDRERAAAHVAACPHCARRTAPERRRPRSRTPSSALPLRVRRRRRPADR